MSGTLRLHQDTVTIRERTGQNTRGVPTYGTAVTYRARVERKPTQVRTLQGEERVSAVQVALAPVTVDGTGALTFIDLPSISPEAELALDGVLDADGNTATPRILYVSEAKDIRGKRRVEIFA